MASQVSLAVTIDVKAPDHDTALRRGFPDTRVDGLAAPCDVPWQTDVDRQKLSYQCCLVFFYFNSSN
jgi:hypothetical protein